MKVVLFFIIFSFNLFAQNNQLTDQQKIVQKQIEEIMKHREEMFRSLLNDDNFGEMEKRMQEMTKHFFDNNSNLNTQNFFGGTAFGEYNWLEDEKYRILSLKVKQIKDKPLDIKIEKGQIKIKGDVEASDESGKFPKHSPSKKITKIHFEQTYSIPHDVDEKNPEFENKDGEVLIKFKKKIPGKLNHFKSREVKPTEKNLEREPVMPSSKDVSI
jgi:HSP20 family molecular chaperone IbpA